MLVLASLSSICLLYTSIPTYFIIDRNNQLQKRDVQIQDLDAEIQHWLGQGVQ